MSRVSLFALAISLALATFPPAAYADLWPHTSGINLPVSTAGSYSTSPATCSDDAGGMYIVWYTDRGSPTYLDIYATHLLATGERASGWAVNGSAVSTEFNNELSPSVCPDGEGGAFVAWQDARLGVSYDIYVHHLLASGGVDPSWPVNGVAVCSAGGDQVAPQIVADGLGGFYVAWRDSRGADQDIFIHHVNAGGVVDLANFPADGKNLANVIADQWSPVIASDAQNGAYVAWHDFRSGSQDVYLTRVTPSGTLPPGWAANGNLVSGASGDQTAPRLAEDGSGGIWIAWQDLAVANFDIRAHRFNPNGTPGGGIPGTAIPVVVEPSNQYLSQVLPDGNGGLHVLWTDYRSGGGEIFAHHILAGGALDPAWISNGNPVAAQPWTESSPVGCSDGAGGLIVSWLDVRDGAQYDVYATRVLPGGAVDGAWPANGVAVSTASNNQQGLVATGDGQSGALFAFTNAGTGGLYAMRVARFGVLGLPEPLIASVKDVPNDEGGRVGVSWYASWLDTAPSSGLYGYDIYRALSSTAAQSALLDGAVMLDGFAEAPAEGVPAIVRLPNQTDDYFWEYAGTVNATHFLQNYGYTATTSGDSTGNDNPRTAFMVVARTFSGEYWPSPPDSGYSVDNLAPVAPAPFTGTYDAGSSALEWEANSEPDLAGYRLYRGKSPGFAIGPASFVAEQTDLEYVDVAGEPFYYKLVAFDSHGNVSAATPLLPSGTVDAPQNSLPRELALAKPAPNPAAGPLTLRWALARSDHATLALFDASGRRVRVLFDGTREAGFHESRWDLRDDVGRPVPPGLYVASLASGGAHRSQRIAVTR